ncbi:FAD-binding oxidoreductase [Mesorhizobium sp. M1142]|uniref:NAD(P)/FAD-dependent oxidoreductase n=1 Tax=Mesorhizobium sp. M1142 TaxID=2957060 RepID=UPI00333CCD3F
MSAQETLRNARSGGSEDIAPDFVEGAYWWDAMGQEDGKSSPGFRASADAAIVGAGVTGLNAAIELARSGRSVAVFDAGVAGFGASSRNTGFLGRFLKKSFAELAKAYGVEKATAYYAELFQALNVSMVEVIQREGINCDFNLSGRVVLARSPSQLRGVVDEFKLRQKHLGEDVHILDRSELQREIRCSNVFCGGVLIPDMATIHPGKYHAGLLAAATKLGVLVYSNARVSGITKSADKFDVETPLGTLRATDVIVATNGYTGKEMNWFARRLVPFQGFAIATEEVDRQRLAGLLPTNRSYTDADFDTMAIRLTPDGKRVITSGRTGKAMPIRAKASLLRKDLLSVLPDLADVRVSYAWSGFCAAPLDTMPKIGQRSDGVWYATGFTFMGMPQGSYFGRKVAFQVLGKPEGETNYSKVPFKSSPFYSGNPWFLRPLMAAMRVKDRFENRRCDVEPPNATFPYGAFL